MLRSVLGEGPEGGVEREARLQRYLRKDYSQVVSFPVEIVGRDGHVRRYGFTESVGLYQRRLRAAPLRHADPRVIDAEVRHCRSRIDQLRRSFLEGDRLGRMLSGCTGDVLGSSLAADVADFVARAFPGVPVLLVPVAAPDAQILQVVAGERAYLLYAWRLWSPSADRVAFRALCARFAASPLAPDVERLQVAMETPDVALLLTGSGRWEGPRTLAPAPASDGEPLEPYDEALRAGLDGQPGHALCVLETALNGGAGRAARPSVLTRAAATMALDAGLPDRAAFFVGQGILATPRDPWLHALGALADVQRGQPDAARARVDAALRAEVAGEGRALLALVGATLAVACVRPRDLVRALDARGRVPRHGPVARAWAAARGRVARRMLLAVAAVAGAVAAGIFASGVLLPVAASGVAGAVVGWTFTAFRRDALRALHGAADAPFALSGLAYLPRGGASAN